MLGVVGVLNAPLLVPDLASLKPASFAMQGPPSSYADQCSATCEVVLVVANFCPALRFPQRRSGTKMGISCLWPRIAEMLCLGGTPCRNK